MLDTRQTLKNTRSIDLKGNLLDAPPSIMIHISMDITLKRSCSRELRRFALTLRENFFAL